MPGPDFLGLPARAAKPRGTGITHVLDHEDQQAWFVRRFGPDVNLANVHTGGTLGLETLRLSLRADTYGAASPGSVAAPAR